MAKKWTNTLNSTVISIQIQQPARHYTIVYVDQTLTLHLFLMKKIAYMALLGGLCSLPVLAQTYKEEIEAHRAHYKD